MAPFFIITLLSLMFICATATIDIPALLNGLAPARPDDPRFTDFQQAGPNDCNKVSMSWPECVGNGFINRDGRDLTLLHLLEGLASGMNIGADFTTAAGGLAISASADPLHLSFNLDELDHHNWPIEHDGSLSRQDAYDGDDHSFYSPNWQQVLSHYDGKSETDIPSAAAARYRRIESSRASNPEMLYGQRQYLLSYGETALYLQAMSNATSGHADIRYVRSLFEEEKLPFDLGWRPSPIPITFASLFAMIPQLQAATQETIPDAFEITLDSLIDLFVVEAGGSDTLSSLTNGISSVLGL